MTALDGLPEAVQEILRQKTIAHAATLGSRGEPQCTPVWFLWDDGMLRFSLTTSRQKFRNLKADPRVALNIVDASNPHAYVEIRGRVDWALDTDNKFIDQLAQWYLGEEHYPWHQEGDERVTITVTPTHATWLVP